jgi:TRAP-type C4-dicarboxylate transport system permease small subunit
MLKKLERFNGSLSGWTAGIGFAAMIFMIVLTAADVLGSKLFLLPVPGSLDMMALAQLIAVSFAAALTLVEQRHVSVEFFVLLLPKRLRALIECAVQLLGVALFAILAWRLFDLGYFYQAGNETSPTIRIPLAPFAYIAAAAMVPVCLVFVQHFLASLLGLVRR